MDEIARRIKDRRIELGMSQDELAKKMGYSGRSTICSIETGKHALTQPKIVQIAKALDVTPAFIMGWQDADGNYYENESTSDIAQEIYDNKELRLLFDAAKGASPETLKQVHNMLLFLKQQETNNSDL